MESPLVVLFEITNAFDSLGIDYVLVGSMASSIHGEYRASGDIDVVAEIHPEHVGRLVSRLEKTFYVDDLSVRRAIAYGRKFNVIHLSAIFKVGVFAASTSLGKQQFCPQTTIRTRSGYAGACLGSHS